MDRHALGSDDWVKIVWLVFPVFVGSRGCGTNALEVNLWLEGSWGGSARDWLESSRL
jgi:hypothetical protein